MNAVDTRTALKQRRLDRHYDNMMVFERF